MWMLGSQGLKLKVENYETNSCSCVHSYSKSPERTNIHIIYSKNVIIGKSKDDWANNTPNRFIFESLNAQPHSLMCVYVHLFFFYNNLAIQLEMCIYWGVNCIPRLKLWLFGKFCTGIIYCNNFDKDFVLWQMSSTILLILSLFFMYKIYIHTVSTGYCMLWPPNHSTIGNLCVCKAWIDGKWHISI